MGIAVTAVQDSTDVGDRNLELAGHRGEEPGVLVTAIRRQLQELDEVVFLVFESVVIVE